MKAMRFFALVIVLMLMAASTVAAGPQAPAAGPCAPGAAYDPACDVDHNGQINVTDIQLTAGHWGHTGIWSADYWSLYGNPGTQPGIHILGTTDPASLALVVDSAPTLRLELTGLVPNIVVGEPANQVTAGAWAPSLAAAARRARPTGSRTCWAPSQAARATWRATRMPSRTAPLTPR